MEPGRTRRGPCGSMASPCWRVGARATTAAAAWAVSVARAAGSGAVAERLVDLAPGQEERGRGAARPGAAQLGHGGGDLPGRFGGWFTTGEDAGGVHADADDLVDEAGEGVDAVEPGAAHDEDDVGSLHRRAGQGMPLFDVG